MSNGINIVIKSQGPPDGGEGHSVGQAVHGNVYGEEGLCANMRGDAQFPRSADKTGQSTGPDHLVRRFRLGTSPHHKPTMIYTHTVQSRTKKEMVSSLDL